MFGLHVTTHLKAETPKGLKGRLASLTPEATTASRQHQRTLPNQSRVVQDGPIEKSPEAQVAANCKARLHAEVSRRFPRLTWLQVNLAGFPIVKTHLRWLRGIKTESLNFLLLEQLWFGVVAGKGVHTCFVVDGCVVNSTPSSQT